MIARETDSGRLCVCDCMRTIERAIAVEREGGGGNYQSDRGGWGVCVRERARAVARESRDRARLYESDS